MKCPSQHVTSRLKLLQLSDPESCSFFFLSYSTVLQNFSRKSRNMVSVRAGQAVVLLCGPPPHYGGTALCANTSALSAVVSCMSQQSLSSLILLIICFPLTPPHLSGKELFYLRSATTLPAQNHAFTSIVHCFTLLNLELTFLARVVFDHAVI